VVKGLAPNAVSIGPVEAQPADEGCSDDLLANLASELSKLSTAGGNWDKKLVRLCGSQRENLEEIRNALEQGASCDSLDVTGATPVMICAMNKTQSTCWHKIKLLLEYGANIDDLPVQQFKSVVEWAEKRIGLDFANNLVTLSKAVKAGGGSECIGNFLGEHGYLFQEITQELE